MHCDVKIAELETYKSRIGQRHLVSGSRAREGSQNRRYCGDVLESAVSTNDRNGVDSQSESRSVRCHVKKIEGNGRVALSIGVLPENIDRLENSCCTI